jgi:hypothetical protein
MRAPPVSRGMVKDDGCAGLHRSGTGDNRFHLAFQALWEVFILEHHWVDLHIREGLTYRCGEWKYSWPWEYRTESCQMISRPPDL